MLNKENNLNDSIYYCYSLNQYLFFKDNGIKSFKRLKSCNEDKYVWLFENNKDLKQLIVIWRNTYPYKRGEISNESKCSI